MSDTENLLDESEVRSFMSALAFVREFSIKCWFRSSLAL